MFILTLSVQIVRHIGSAAYFASNHRITLKHCGNNNVAVFESGMSRKHQDHAGLLTLILLVHHRPVPVFTPIPAERALMVIERLEVEPPVEVSQSTPQTQTGQLHSGVNCDSAVVLLPARTRDNERTLIYVHLQVMKQRRQELIWAAYDAGQAVIGCEPDVDLFAPSPVCRFNSRISGGIIPYYSSRESLAYARGAA